MQFAIDERARCLGGKNAANWELFIPGSLRQLIPDDHVLVRVERVLDLSWLRDEVADCYCLEDGQPGIDPEAAVRLMLAGLLSGIVHDRRLMREAQVNLAIRWFAGYALHEKLPDHSSLTRIRQRWGPERERGQILYASHRARVEGVHGEEKAWHGLARAVRRGLANMKIQAYLTAAAVNLKRLAAAVAALLLMLLPIHRRSRPCTAA